MTAFNVVRFRIKPGREQQFIDAHKNARLDVPGFLGGTLIKTGERSYCFIGEWDQMNSMSQARPAMISILDSFRDTLEDQGNGLGVTDPVSGETVAKVPSSSK